MCGLGHHYNLGIFLPNKEDSSATKEEIVNPRDGFAGKGASTKTDNLSSVGSVSPSKERTESQKLFPEVHIQEKERGRERQ